MRVLLYVSKFPDVEKSGVGMALRHQKKALDLVGVDYTTNPNDDYDIIHVNTIFPDSILITNKAKQKGKKVVFHAHSTEEDFKNSFKFSNIGAPAFKQWLKHCYNKADILLTPTPYSKKLLESYGLKQKIIPISNGIDLNFWKKNANDRENFIKKYNLSKNDKIIMSVGLYIERKGMLEFIELARRMSEYKFIWFGYTAPSLRTKKIADALKNKPDNLILPGYVNSDELREAYGACDIYVFPTKEETEGIVLLEALAMKIDTIISDIPIYDDWLKDGYNVYKAKTVSDFEAKIRGIFDKSLPSVTDMGYKIAKQRDIKKIGLELKRIYESLLVQNVTK